MLSYPLCYSIIIYYNIRIFYRVSNYLTCFCIWSLSLSNPSKSSIENGGPFGIPRIVDPGTSIHTSSIAVSLEKPLTLFNTLNIKNGNDLAPKDFRISAVYPNPNNGQCKIDISINNAANYKISLIDINGRVINNIFDRRLNKGKYTFTINEIRSSGVYFIILEKDDLFVIKKFVRLK